MPRGLLTPRRRLLIAGLGNVLLRDDGVGVHAARALLCEDIPGVVVVEIGTAVLDALHLLESAAVVLALDAVQAGGPPGTVYQVLPDGSAGRAPLDSVHDLDLRRAVTLLPAERRPRIVVLGVEPAAIEPGLELSPAVRSALPRLLAAVRRAAAALAAGEGEPLPPGEAGEQQHA
ncbi:MAG: hydrogenase maturation protease [Planctomycetes bacterium]|nr:hydrogenase maturation protease [Planctomycetota bacterium]